MKILVVEHDTQRATGTVAMLRRWKMEAVLVADVAGAQSLLAQGGIDLVLADLHLAGQRGTELVRALRASPEHGDLPVLMTSGEADRDDIVAASQAGVDAFLARPFEPEQLRQRLLEVYRRHHQTRRVQAAAEVWSGQASSEGAGIEGPLALFGEAIDGAAALGDPAQRPVTDYLALARDVIVRLNDHRDGPVAGYLIANTTTEVILSLKRPGLRDWVRVVFVSTKCHGNPTLMARLFAINRRGNQATLYLVYDEVDEITQVHRKGLKDLGVRTLRRSRIDEERMTNVLSRHLVADPRLAVADDDEEELPPQQIRSRIVDDIDTMSTLPPIPQVYERISELARDPGSDLKDWIKVVQVDPLTCATILRQANSVNYGFQGEVTEIDRAVILLGKNVIVGLVASTAMRKSLQAIAEKGFSLEELWLHSLAVGAAANILSHPLHDDVENLAPVASLGLGPEALEVLRGINLAARLGLDYVRVNPFAAGAMHDVGKGVMVHAYPGLFPLLRDELEERQWQRPMLAAERDVAGGLTHTVAGDILVRKWGMSEQLGNAVAGHHTADVDDGLAFLVGIADVVGQITHPFPRAGAYPLARALEDRDWDTARPFLPDEFLEQPLLHAEELAQLTRHVGPPVRTYVEAMRRSL